MKPTKQALSLFLILAAFLAGCATPPPRNFDEHVIAINTALKLTNDTALILVNGGHVSKQKGRAVHDKTVPLGKALDVADSYDDLHSITDLLKEVQDELCKEVPSNPNCALLLSEGAKL